VAGHAARSIEPPSWKQDYGSHLTTGKCPCPKEIKEAQHGTKREGDEKDGAQLRHSVVTSVTHYDVKALTKVNTKR
jgi:hypothetical protein